MKIFISADIEGVNNIANWLETEKGDDYEYFRKEMTEEVKSACLAAKAWGCDEILIKDAHDNARNLILKDLPDFVKLHRGWEGNICSMMAGLDKSFDAAMFIGYHSPSRSDGNPLSHTMNLRIHHVKINNVIASEFYINALYAAYLNIPVIFVSGDENLTRLVQEENENIETVATKTGVHGAVISRHPDLCLKEIGEKVKKALNKDISLCILKIPKHFDVEIQYNKHYDAFSNSFYPGCKLVGSDRIIFSHNDYYEVLRMLKFTL